MNLTVIFYEKNNVFFGYFEWFFSLDFFCFGFFFINDCTTIYISKRQFGACQLPMSNLTHSTHIAFSYTICDNKILQSWKNYRWKQNQKSLHCVTFQHSLSQK